MRKQLSTAMVIVAALLVVSVPAVQGQQDQAQEQTVEGNLKSVDVENSTIVLVPEGQPEITLSVTEETVLRDEAGTEITLETLLGREGASLRAAYEGREEGNVALSIEVMAGSPIVT